MPENENDLFRNDSQETISPAAPEISEAPVQENQFAPAEIPVKKKKKGKKIAIISGITAAVLIGGGAAAYNLSDFVKNQVNLLIMKPEKYYEWVTEKNAAVYADKAAASYNEDLKSFDSGQTTSIELKYNVSDEAKDIIIEKLNEDPDATEDGLDMLTDIINNADDLSVLLTGQSKKTDGALSLGANLNGESLLSLDLAVDMLNPKLFMRYPEMKEQWIGMDIIGSIDDSIETSEEQEIFDKIFAFYQGIINDPSGFIHPKELKNAVNNYSAAWIKSISDVDRERREKVGIGDINVKYTTLEVDINSKLAVKILRNFLNEAADDKVIQRTVIDRLELLSEDEYDDLFDIILNASKLIETDSKDVFSLKTYIDAKGNIRGFSICEDDVEIFYAMGKHKDDFAIEFSVTSEDTKMVRLTLNAEETSKETYEGSLSLNFNEKFVSLIIDAEEAEDYTISMDFEDMTIGSLENIKLTGSAVLNIPDAEPVELEFKGKNDTQTISYSIEADGTEFGDISLTFTTKNKASFEIPEVDDSYMVDAENSDSFNFYDYIEYDDLVNYFTDLLVQFGIDEDIAAEIAENAAYESFYGSDEDHDFVEAPDSII